MSEAKPFASLSSGLLARKGAAKPAMRPQAYGHIGASLEDLGWDDMGQAPSDQGQGSYDQGPHEHVPSSIAALTPAPGGWATAAPPEAVAPDEEPPVVQQQRELEETFAPEPEELGPEPQEPEQEPETAKVVHLPQPQRKLQPQSRPLAAKAKAAFTLRLDADRHLKLRLACALTRRSAQQIVTEALDELLNSLPQVEALARQVPDTGKKGG